MSVSALDCCFRPRFSNFTISFTILDSEISAHSSPETPQAETSEPLKFWRGLAQIAREANLSELEVERDGVRVILRAVVSLAPASTALPVSTAAAIPTSMPLVAAKPSTPAARDENLIEIVSPMVGVFYRAPSPSDPNFVEVGDKVEVGQTVALVEAMKVFNEITSEVSGVVVEIKAAGSDLVETGQVLLTLRK